MEIEGNRQISSLDRDGCARKIIIAERVGGLITGRECSSIVEDLSAGGKQRIAA
jgi:hypothetical protein